MIIMASMAEDTVVRICATGDLHLGMKFANYPDVAEELSAARYTALEKIVFIGSEKNCDLLVVAGDLFDRVNVSKKEIMRAAGILNDFKGKGVCILPGNHDYFAGKGSTLWSVFREETGGNVLFLGQKKPYSLRHLDLDCLILPGPCESKHSPLHALSWISAGDAPEHHAVTVGIVHGSVEGVSPDFDDQYYPMKLGFFDDLPASLWIAGHTHQAQEHKLKNCTVVFPGTPEPDGFDFTRKGTASCIEIDGSGTVVVEQVETGGYLFKRETREIAGLEDLDAVLKGTEDENCADVKKTLLKLALKGRVAPETFEGINRLRRRLSEAFFYSEVDDTSLSLKITREMVEKEFSRGSFPYLLLMELLDGGDSEALHTAYDLLLEARV